MWAVLLVLVGLLSVVLLLGRRRRREGEPQLIQGWVPYIGKALDFGLDSNAFLKKNQEKYGDVFTVYIAGKYMTFIMDPLLFPSIMKYGRQLDFHDFVNQVAPVTFGYPPVSSFPDMDHQIQRSFRLLQGDNLLALTESMMGNLQAVFRQDFLGDAGGEAAGEGWSTGGLYDFCSSLMFEATFLTLYGSPDHACRHSDMAALRHHFTKFDNMFPLLVAGIPIWLLGRTKATREKLIRYFLPQRMLGWSNTSLFITMRSRVFEQNDMLSDTDKGAHHFAILWASVGNTVPASFWALYYLINQQEALQAIRQELHRVLQHPESQDPWEPEVMISKDQLEQLVYMESAINESLRLSSASMNIRVAQQDFTLQLDKQHAVAVRRGDFIALYPQMMHMDPEIFTEPQVYKYDRFIEDGREKTDFFKRGQKLKFYRMPFGSGSSICPGRFFAINEIKQFLCLLLIYLDMEMEEGQEEAQLDNSRAGLGILLPTKDVRFRYRLRRPTS
ncbi:hypothetical protein NHX12_002385 [Muraenolepis orangiensis]|uniref:Cytochrome P450 7B1 n=1 Tax=Muraenolepis orangiensis TaxID=630683 RepID=A0A9Q0IGC3_9TELE|nr:hypothetical protein NHX12_002385 [Muraenolepis orangiensis]